MEEQKGLLSTLAEALKQYEQNQENSKDTTAIAIEEKLNEIAKMISSLSDRIDTLNSRVNYIGEHIEKDITLTPEPIFDNPESVDANFHCPDNEYNSDFEEAEITDNQGSSFEFSNSEEDKMKEGVEEENEEEFEGNDSEEGEDKENNENGEEENEIENKDEDDEWNEESESEENSYNYDEDEDGGEDEYDEEEEEYENGEVDDENENGDEDEEDSNEYENEDEEEEYDGSEEDEEYNNDAENDGIGKNYRKDNSSNITREVAEEQANIHQQSAHDFSSERQNLKKNKDWYDWEYDYPAEYVDNIMDSLGINDKLEFVRELFHSDTRMFERQIAEIETMSNFKSVVQFLRQAHPEWDEDSSAVYKLYMHIRRKFRN